MFTITVLKFARLVQHATAGLIELRRIHNYQGGLIFPHNPWADAGGTHPHLTLYYQPKEKR
jgi:hypothetical protein